MREGDLFTDAVVAIDGISGREWLQAADIVVARHRSRIMARRWMTTARRRFPGCIVVLSRHHGGRWCVIGFASSPTVLTVHSSHRRRLPAASSLGRFAFSAWLLLSVARQRNWR